jgi:hypothetical protein
MDNKEIEGVFVRFDGERLYRARIVCTAGIEMTRCGASTFYPRPQNREKTLLKCGRFRTRAGWLSF